MSARRRKGTAIPQRWYRGDKVPLSAIRRFTREVVRRFHPNKIILFGSHAYGIPHEDSDVDILVVMQTRSRHGQSIKIRMAIPTPFAMDLLVRTPEFVNQRLAEGDSFLEDIWSRGIVLYEKVSQGVGAKGRSRLSSRRTPAALRPTRA
jgi:predicted nucleotidyltransferase